MPSANNTVTLSGRLVADPETHGKLQSFRLAVDRSGPTFSDAGFFSVTVFDANKNAAKVTKEYLKKGMPINIVGRLKMSKGKDDKNYIDIVAEDIQMIGSKKDNVASSSAATEESDDGESLEAALEAGL